jgi:AcrR family transcriptional regulator
MRMSTQIQAPPKKRRQGRPPKKVQAVGRDKLVAVARQLLKTKPPGQISGLEIARTAGVDPALIRYYFGNKSGLFVAAAWQALAELRERQRVKGAGINSAAERLKQRIRTLLESEFEDPSLHHLIVDRIIHSKSKEARALRRDAVRQACAAFAEIIEQGVASGELSHVDPRHLYLAVIGACSFPMAERDLFAELMGGRPNRAHVEAYADFLANALLSGLAQRSR